MTEAEPGVMWTQGKECWATSSWKKQRTLPWNPGREEGPLTPFRLLASRTLRQHLCGPLHPRVHVDGNLGHRTGAKVRVWRSHALTVHR